MLRSNVAMSTITFPRRSSFSDIDTDLDPDVVADVSALQRGTAEAPLPFPADTPVAASDHRSATEVADLRQLIRAARARADQIIAAAELVEEESRLRGFNEGMQCAESRFEAALTELARFREDWCRSSAELLSELLWEVAREVIGEAVRDSPSSLRARIERAIRLYDLGAAGGVRIELSPADALALRATDVLSPSSTVSLMELPVSADPHVERGVAVVVRREGTVEVDPVAHLASIRALFEDQQLLGHALTAVLPPLAAAPARGVT